MLKVNPANQIVKGDKNVYTNLSFENKIKVSSHVI